MAKKIRTITAKELRERIVLSDRHYQFDCNGISCRRCIFKIQYACDRTKCGGHIKDIKNKSLKTALSKKQDDTKIKITDIKEFLKNDAKLYEKYETN